MKLTFLEWFLLLITVISVYVAHTANAKEYESCGHVILDQNFIGVIRSPVYNTSDGIQTYSPNQNCSWLIKFPYPYINKIQLNITRLNLDRLSNGCDHDVVMFFYPAQPPGLHPLCEMPSDNPRVFSDTNTLSLTFHSGNRNNYNPGENEGFAIYYAAICDETHTYLIEEIQEEIEIKSPPRSSFLEECSYRWHINETLDLGAKNMLIMSVSGLPERSTSHAWKAEGKPISSSGTCLPYHNVTIGYGLPPVGSQPQNNSLVLKRATIEQCGCLLTPCQNRGTCFADGDAYRCECMVPFKGKTCEERDDLTGRYTTVRQQTTETESDGVHCDSGQDLYPGIGIEWSRTKIGNIDTQPCPNAAGNATRPCTIFGSAAKWGQPDLSGCVSKLFVDIFKTAKLLSNAEQVEANSILNITSALTAATSMTANTRMFAGDLNAATNTLETVSGIVAKMAVNSGALSEIAQGYGDAVGNIVDPATSAVWRFTRAGYLENRLTSLLDSMETLSANIATKATELLSKRRRSFSRDKTLSHRIVTSASNLDFEVQVFDREYGFDSMKYNGNMSPSGIILPASMFRTALQRTSNAYIHLYNGKFTSISQLLAQTHLKIEPMENASTPVINSDIIASKVLNANQDIFSSLAEPVKLLFRLQNSTLSKTLAPECVFLNMSATTESNRWLRNGCRRSEAESNRTYTVCYCYHLTNFAVLMDLYGVEDSIDELNSKILTYLSYAGGALSILGCVLSIIVFEFFRLKNERIRIHEQLALSIILVQIFFLVGIDRTESRYVCMAMAICLHFFLVAMFCWMLVEGAHLYLMLVKVFQSGSHMKKYIAIGWGVPVVVVGITAGIFHDEYGVGNICWLSQKVLLVAFVPAVGLVIVINTVILLIVMKIMMTSLSKGSKVATEDKSSVRIGIKAAAVLLPLLGLTWTFGFLSVTSEETLIFTYLFTLFNSMQGVFFFVFHCLLSVDVQNAYDRRSRRMSHLKLTETSISKQHSRRSSESALSKHSINTLMTDMASTLERRRSNRNSYTSIDRPQSVTFDDDVFLPHDGPVTRNSFRSNSSRNSFHDIVGSSPMPALEKVQGYRNNVLNNSSRSTGSMSSDGYLFYSGKDKKALNEMGIYDYDKNHLYATVNK